VSASETQILAEKEELSFRTFYILYSFLLGRERNKVLGVRFARRDKD
jgi:hypothetical protein